MATRKAHSSVTPKLQTSFIMPDNFRAFGIAPVSEDRAWARLITWPVVVLIDNNGKVHQTGYGYKELKKIGDTRGLHSVVDATQDMHLEGHTIEADDNGNCFMLSTERGRGKLHHIDKTGTMSNVLSDLGTSAFDMHEGLAYLIDSPDRKRVLFGGGSKGIRSVKWPRNKLVSLFLSPTVDSFCSDHKDAYSFAVDKKSDLICISTISNKIIVLTRNGEKISEYCDDSDTEDCLDQHVMFDHTGCIIVFNRTKSLVFRLSTGGQFIQTLFPEIKDSKLCEDCKKLQSPPFCRECKDKIIITAIGIHEDILWVCRLSGEVEIYRLL